MNVGRHECMNGEILIMQKIGLKYTVYVVSAELCVAPTYYLQDECLQHACEIYNEKLAEILASEVCEYDEV